MSQVTFIFEPRFISSLVPLPREIHSKLVKCLSLLTKERHHPSLNDEVLRGRANGLRSARVDREYRLVYEERSENEIKLLLVAKHDEAYREADRIKTPAAPTPFEPKTHKAVRASLSIRPLISAAPATLLRLISPSAKKYLPLSKFLVEKPPELRRLELSFAEMIMIIGAELPKSAYLYSAWWANDPTHVQAAAWLTAGWKATDLRLEDRQVSFERGA